MAKEIDKIIQSKTAPKSNNVLWDDGENLKINRNSKWESVSGGDNNYSKLERALKYSSITIIGDEDQDYYGFADKYRDMPFESFMKEELQVEYGNGVKDSLTIRLFLEDLNRYKSCRLLLSEMGTYYVLNLSYYYTRITEGDLYNCILIFGGADNNTGIMLSFRAFSGDPVEVDVTEI